MATITLVPSQLNNAASQYVTVSNESNMYTDTASTTYATLQNITASTSNRYVYLKGFNFDSVPTGATVSSFTVKLKGYYTSGSQQTLYLCNGTTTQSGATATGLTTSTQTRTFSNGSLTWAQISGWGDDFGIRINCRRGSRNQTAYYYIYGAEIDVTYTEPSVVHVTGVGVSPSTVSIEVGTTSTLTATVSPSNATDKSVSWSTSNSSVATVSNGVVTGVGAGSATITVTTTDGGYTATCAVTVTQPVLHDYIQTNTLEAGKSYLIVNGNSGTVYMLSNESGGSRQLKGVATTISNGKISISTSVEAKCLFECSLYTAGDDVTTCLSIDGSYLYSDNSSGLRMYTSPNNKHWHYVSDGHKFWLYRGTTNGYTDDTTEYKYYLTLNSSNNYTDSHIGTSGQSIENSTLPEMYLFRLDDGTGGSKIYVNNNGTWTQYSKAYKKINGSWVEQSDLTTVFNGFTNYIKGN